MGRSGGPGGDGGKKKKGKNKKNGAPGSSGASQQQEGLILVDPARVRFQHSRIRPHFSGCGRSIFETLESIRKGEISANDLPPIQVIIGPETNDEQGPWYFSLNNRRLWVLKRCREEGLLQTNNNQIQVRVRAPKSDAEAARYSLENCALEAKVMREATKGNNEAKGDDRGLEKCRVEEQDDVSLTSEAQPDNKQLSQTDSTTSNDEEEDNDSDDEDGCFVSKNPFSALM